MLALEAGLELVNAIHPSALIMEDAILGKNIIMHAHSFFGYRAELHDGVTETNREYLEKRGHFVVLCPETRVVGKEGDVAI